MSTINTEDSAKEGIIENILYLHNPDFDDCQNTRYETLSDDDIPIIHRNILEPFEPYLYNPICGSKERIIKKISYLPDSECIDCQNTRQETLSKDNESCLYGNLHCNVHALNFCSNCQIDKPNGYQYVGYKKGYGFCSNCVTSNCKYIVRELSEHFHNTYCVEKYSRCNYSEDKYCVYFHSAILYDKNGGNIFQSIENLCKDAILAREKNIKSYINV